MKIRQTGISVLSLLLLSVATAQASEALQNRPAVSDAGSLLSELEPKRQITPRPQQPYVDVEQPQGQPQGQQLTAHIRKIVFVSDDLEINERLQPLTAGKTGRELTFAEMQELAAAATQALRREGYLLALVYVPAQDLQDGVLKLQGIIGRYGDIELNNHSQLTDERLLGYTYALRPGRLIKSQPLDKTLLILNELPGVEVRSSLAPGKKMGTAKLVLNATTLQKQGGSVYFDNYGSKSTGVWRYGVDYHYDNPSQVGDQIDLSYLTSARGMNNYQLRYSLPLGRDGVMSRISYSHMNYELGNRWSYLDGDGVADTLEIGVSVPMQRSLKYSSWYDISYRNRALSDNLFASLLESEKTSDAVQLETHGYLREDDYSTSYSFSHTMGQLGMDSAYAQQTDMLQTAGWFSKSNASLYHIQRLSDRWQLHASVNAQYAWDNLDSSEDFYISGANGVRAFPQGEAGGDSGILGTLEFRYRTGCPELQLTAFADAGRVFYNHASLAGDDSANTGNLVGAGLGFIYASDRNWFAKFDWATPIGQHYSSSEGSDIHNTWWLRVVKQF